MLLGSVFPVYATSNEEVSVKGCATLVISDPETNEKWEWNIPVERQKIMPNNANGNASSEIAGCANVELDISEYLKQTYEPGQSNVSNEFDDDVKIQLGIFYTYNVLNQTIKLDTVYGTITNKGFYYATDREVYYTNQYAGLKKYEHPNSNAWSYAVNPATYARYNPEVPPFTRLSCDIHITNMSAYREIWVTCAVNC